MCYKSNNTQSFLELCSMFSELLNIENVKSNLRDASLDKHNNNKSFYLYDGKYCDMDTLKLDEMTNSFEKYMRNQRKQKHFQKSEAVDAVCVNDKNEWFLIEFKNKPMREPNDKTKANRANVSEIKSKMFSSLWLLFTINSFAGKQLFSDDITEFSRNHITYIVVVSRKKNTEEYQRIFQSPYNLYTPEYLRKYTGYYFKDIFMFTEDVFAKFVKNFKC